MTPRPVRLRDGVPVYAYDTAPDIPPVSVAQFDPAAHLPGEGRPHIHEFPVLMVAEDEVLIVTPGAVIDPRLVEVHGGAMTSVTFQPSSFSADLLAPFHQAGGVTRIPIQRSKVWEPTLESLSAELARRDDRYRMAVTALGTLLLIELGRLVSAESVDAQLERVFAVIEKGFRSELSLQDVARDVGLSSGYLTTLVRRRTGKPVQRWITERRILEARRLLAETSTPIGVVARNVGLADPAYFARVFRREVGVTPREWRATA